MRLLITGGHGFTGQALTSFLKTKQIEYFCLGANLLDANAIRAEIQEIKPSHIIHLAALSYTDQSDALDYYRTNLIGTENLLDALLSVSIIPQKIIIASSAHVYGNQGGESITEDIKPQPITHYAISKLGAEFIGLARYPQLPIVITRPFNYTGVGHSSKFVIPKIVDHFLMGAREIELGNIEVYREYNDVRDICEIYYELLQKGKPGCTYNLASGRTYSLREVIDLMIKITGRTMAISINPELLRRHEITILSGNPMLLMETIGPRPWRSLTETLEWMLANPKSL